MVICKRNKIIICLIISILILFSIVACSANYAVSDYTRVDFVADQDGEIVLPSLRIWISSIFYDSNCARF